MATPPITGGVDRSRGPISLESTANLSNDRGKDKTNGPLGSAPPGTRTTHNSTCRLSNEIVKMIISCFICDLEVLKECSRTCRSWHTIVAPHLYCSLTLRDKARPKGRRMLKPLSRVHGLGLAPFIKKIRVTQRGTEKDPWFTPQAFGPNDLHHFSAFTNVRTLVIRIAEISEFIPDVEQYFGHLSSNLRSIALADPRCTPRQLSHFLSLFPNLDDIRVSSPKQPSNQTIPDTELVPFSAPKLQGRLELYVFDWVETWTDLITLCGGLRFHYMHLHRVEGCAPVLLGACAETLETLRCSVLGAVSPSLLPEFDLSQLKVLRSLQVKDWAAKPDVENRHNIVMEIFSTITSLVFSELVIVLRDKEIPGLPLDVTLFEKLRAMKQVRPFKLVFLLDDLHQVGEKRQRKLVGALDLAKANGLLDFLDFPPIIR